MLPRNGLYLPQWRVDETLYSWCAHYHALTSNSDSRITSRQLFGFPRAGLRYDFPVCLDSLVERTEGALGSKHQILLDRSPLQAFVRFIAGDRLSEAFNFMGAGPAHRIPRRLGLSRHRIPAPLKACPECQSDSLSKECSTAWHVDHQLPGVYICHRHDTLLQVATIDAHHRARREFLLPHNLKRHEWHPSITLSNDAALRLQCLSEWSRALRVTSHSTFVPFDAVTMRDTCHLRALQKDFVGIDGSLNFKSLRLALHGEYAELVNIPGLEFLNDTQKESGGFVGLLLHQYHGTHHPLMHCVLLSFLFESPAEFFMAYGQAAELDPALRREPLRAKRSTVCHRLADLVRQENMSVNKAAQVLGIEPARAVALLTEMNVEYKMRPRIVGTEIERKLCERLELGEEPALIASSLGIRRGFIKNYLATQPELRDRHTKKLSYARREAYRAKFLSTLASYPSLPIKRLRRETNSGFEWLYRNDREWLIQILPGIWHR